MEFLREDSFISPEVNIRILRELRREKQRSELIAALQKTGGNISQAAIRLGKSRGAVRYQLRKYALM